MYVKDVEDGKRTYTHIFAHNFLNMVWFECNAIYVEDVEDRSNTQRLKIHTNMFLLITSLIFNRFSIRKKFWKAET